MGLQFANPALLLLLWLVPVLAAWWRFSARRQERKLAEFISPAMQRKLSPPASGARAVWQGALAIAGLCLLIVAAGRPQWGTRKAAVFERGRDLIIALDVSRSMLAADVHPDRLGRAKADLLDLIRELRGDRAGLLVFRRTALLLCPLTSDYAFLKQALDAAGPESAPAGETDIGDAIVKALEAFESDDSSHKAVILVSDGEDLGGKAMKAAEEAGRKRIPIFTVGLGSRAGSRIPNPDQGGGYVAYQGADVRSTLDDKTLLSIARATGGAYIPIETASMTTVTLGSLYRDYLRKITARDYQERRETRRVDRFQLFLLPGLLALLAASFLSRGRLAAAAPRLPRTPPPLPGSGQPAPPALKDLTPPARPIRAIGLALCVAGASAAGECLAATGTVDSAASPAQAGASAAEAEPIEARAGGRAAQRLFDLGRYEQAAERYLGAARGATGDLERDLRYNAAAALYRAGKYVEAASVLREILLAEQPPAAETAQGLGAALYRDAAAPPASRTNTAAQVASLLAQSAEAFKDAARAGGERDKARANLDVVLRRLDAAREDAKIEKLMEQYGQAAAGDIADRMLSAQREVLSTLDKAATNKSPSVVTEMESAARAQREASDLWIPLKGKLIEAAPEDQRPSLADFAENTRENMLLAADRARDLDPAAGASAAGSEARVYNVWKGVVPHGPLLREDMRRQTNAASLIAANDPAAGGKLQPAKAEQKEALELTRLFAKRFQEAVPEGGLPAEPAAGDTQDAPAATNARPPLISAEDRAKVVALSEEAASTQEKVLTSLEASSLPDARAGQARAQELLGQIQALLPKQPQQQKQDNSKQDQQKQKPSPEQQQQQDKPQEQPQEQPQQKEEPQQQEPKPEEQKDVSRQELERMLDKALQREKEHEAEKRERDRRIPMSPAERDW